MICRRFHELSALGEGSCSFVLSRLPQILARELGRSPAVALIIMANLSAFHSSALQLHTICLQFTRLLCNCTR